MNIQYPKKNMYHMAEVVFVSLSFKSDDEYEAFTNWMMESKDRFPVKTLSIGAGRFRALYNKEDAEQIREYMKTKKAVHSTFIR